jgi:transitional endoplasmic reticulum ATPase
MLKIKDGPLMKKGTSLVEIFHSFEDQASSVLGQTSTGWQRVYVKLSSGEKTVGATVEGLRVGTPTAIVDPSLRLELGVPEEAVVSVEPLSPVQADLVEIGFPDCGLGAGELVRLSRTYLFMQPVSRGQNKPAFLYSGKQIDLQIVRVVPEDLSIFTNNTRIMVSPVTHASEQPDGFADIGGLARDIKLIKERIVSPLRNRELFASMGISSPRGILLTGPHGCGKTLLAGALSRELGFHRMDVSGPEVFAGFYGESEKRIRRIFSEAREEKPSLIIFDEIDALAPSRRRISGELERRIVTMLLAEMDGLRDNDEVVVVGTTNDADSIDSALRRPGRLDFELRIGVPDQSARLSILEIHSRHIPLQGVSLEAVARLTQGFSGADLMNLCREAAFNAMQRLQGESPWEENMCQPQASLPVLQQDFEEALKGLRPSSLREFAIEVPGDLSWDSIGGLNQIKSSVIEEIVQAVAHPEVFIGMGIRPVRGVLLYGPPGTGKTLLARVVANQAGANFISVRGPEILSKWVGESEQRIREIFERARQVSPCIIFFDEIDAITAARGKGTSDVADRIVNQLLTEMDGFQTGRQVCVIAATNRQDLLDPALLRPGRFDYALEIPLPDAQERAQIFRIHLKGIPQSNDVDIDALEREGRTGGFSGAHIEEVCRRAALEALREASFDASRSLVAQLHVRNAVATVKQNIERLETKVRVIGF